MAFTASFPGNAQPFAPQQVFISLKSRASGALVLVAAKAAQSSANDYTATVGSSTVAKQIGPQVHPSYSAIPRQRHSEAQICASSMLGGDHICSVRKFFLWGVYCSYWHESLRLSF